MNRVEGTSRNDCVPWRTPKQIAGDLQVTLRTVQRWVASGALPVHRFGRSVRVSDVDYRRFIARGREAGDQARGSEDGIK